MWILILALAVGEHTKEIRQLKLRVETIEQNK